MSEHPIVGPDTVFRGYAYPMKFNFIWLAHLLFKLYNPKSKPSVLGGWYRILMELCGRLPVRLGYYGRLFGRVYILYIPSSSPSNKGSQSQLEKSQASAGSVCTRASWFLRWLFPDWTLGRIEWWLRSRLEQTSRATRVPCYSQCILASSFSSYSPQSSHIQRVSMCLFIFLSASLSLVR